LIRCKVYSPTGQSLGSVTLDILKARAGYRLQQALFTKGSGVVPGDLLKLDSGQLLLSTLAKVYTPDEIRAAIVKHRTAIEAEREGLDELLARLEDPGFWSASAGGEQAPNRFGIKNYREPTGAGRDRFGGNADRGDDHETRSKAPDKGTTRPLVEIKSAGAGVDPMRKSPETIRCVEIAKSHGLRVSSRSMSDGGLSFDGRQGYQLALHPDGSWESEVRGEPCASGSAGQLARHLGQFHKRD
jgi:hypothetical protein